MVVEAARQMPFDRGLRAIRRIDSDFSALLDELPTKSSPRTGRYDEVDLYNRPGGYIRRMDSRAAGQPCPTCGTPVEKTQYLGGACYFCPHRQA
jgi:formamidopyrimidine-DNA glycosylase